jgi:hypothetical protein
MKLANIDLHLISQNKTFSELFYGVDSNLEKIAFTPKKALEVLEKNIRDITSNSFGAIMLLKINEIFRVAYICRQTPGLGRQIFVQSLDDNTTVCSEHCRFVVTPKLH